jgi:hypothetical protein
MDHFCYFNFYSKGSKHYKTSTLKTSTLKVGKPHGNVGTHFHTCENVFEF